MVGLVTLLERKNSVILGLFEIIAGFVQAHHAQPAAKVFGRIVDKRLDAPRDFDPGQLAYLVGSLFIEPEILATIPKERVVLALKANPREVVAPVADGPQLRRSCLADVRRQHRETSEQRRGSKQS